MNPRRTKVQHSQALPVPSQRDRSTGSRPHEFSSVFSLCSLCSLCPLCEPCFSRHKQTRIAPSHKEGTLTPRCCTWERQLLSWHVLKNGLAPREQ